MRELINKIIEKVRINEKDSILLDSSDSSFFEINKERFSDISKFQSNKKIAFVDGGDLEILKAPSVSLFFNRVYYSIYQTNKRCENKIYEFFTLISAENKESKIVYKSECHFTKNSLPVKDLYFNSFDPSLIKGGKRADISAVGNVVRRLAELSAAKEIDADFIILDGTLEAVYLYEKEIIDSIKTPMFGLSKTTTLLTKGGSTAVATLRTSTNKDNWIYYLGRIDEKNHNADLFFLKLSKKAEYILRFEACKKDNADEVISLLAENSRDPVFPGYPYGFIEADRFGRVSKKEKDALQLQLRVLLGKEEDKIKPFLNSLNAHDVLDSIS